MKKTERENDNGYQYKESDFYSSYKKQYLSDESGRAEYAYSHLFGNRTDDTDCSYLIRMADRGFSGNIPGTDRERVYSLDFLPQEFPVYGDGDYRVDCLKADLGSGVQDGMFFFCTAIR